MRTHSSANSRAQHSKNQTPILAELIDSSQCQAEGLVARGHAPVLMLCRQLLAAGFDPDTPLETYRGTTLCLRVRTIRAGAALTVKESTRDGRPRFVSFDDPSVRCRPPVRETARPLVEERSEAARAYGGGEP